MTPQELHETLKHHGGFTKHYNLTNKLIGTKVTIGKRLYKITMNDIALLNHLLGFQIPSVRDDGAIEEYKEEDHCCYESNSKISEILNISINTLLDSYRKLKALGLISQQQIGEHNCRMHVNINALATLLGIIKPPTKKKLDPPKRVIRRAVERQLPTQEEENPF